MAQGQPEPGDPGKATAAAQSRGSRAAQRPASWRALAGGSTFRELVFRALAPRLALAAVLVAVVLAGARAAVPRVTWDNGPWHHDGVLLGIGLEVVFVALLVTLEVRRRRWPEPDMPVAGLRQVLRGGLAAAAVAILVLILIDSVGNLKPGQHPVVVPPLHRAAPPPPIRPHLPPAHGGTGIWVPILYTVLALVLAAAVVVCVILLRRRTRGTTWADGGEIAEDEPAEQLRRAVRSGQAALSEIDDARLAIIACYVAMERSLARAGAVRAAAETPDELLSRAAAAGIVGGTEAAALTALFYEARFSSHPLPGAKRHQAQRALDVLAVALEAKAADLQRAAAAQAAAAAGQAAAGAAAGTQAGAGAARPGGPQ
jgi:Domain of unknown function (DUF4129)